MKSIPVSSHLVALALACAFPAVANDPGPVRQDHAAFGGGPPSTSPDYTHVGEFVGVGGPVAAASDTILRPGFLGQLNDPPRAESDLLRRPVGLGTKTAAATLLANDVDPEGGPLRIAAFLVASGATGTVKAEDGWLLYDPPPGASAPDRFHYWVEDAEGDRALGTVAVEVDARGPVRGLNLLRIAPHPSGGMELRFLGLPHRWYRFESSPDAGVGGWQVMDRRRAAATGLLVIHDPVATGTRFYRTIAEILE